jgi:hypothetical protein
MYEATFELHSPRGISLQGQFPRTFQVFPNASLALQEAARLMVTIKSAMSERINVLI